MITRECYLSAFFSSKIILFNKPFTFIIPLVFCFAVLVTLLCLPADIFGMEGLTVIKKRVIAIFLFATFMWVLEPVPAWTTSMLIVGLLLFTSSDSALWLFKDNASPEIYGTPVKYTSVLHSFADPIIMLFIGGFILAIAATKCGLDGIEAMTPFPQGDVSVEEIRDAVGDKLVVLDGIAAILFNETYPVSMLVEQVEKLIEYFAGRLILGISDEMPSQGKIERVELVRDLVNQYNKTCG